MANQNVPFTIYDFCNIVKSGRLDLIEKVLSKNGIPKSEPGVTDYLLLQSIVKNKSRKIAKLMINGGCRVNPSPSEIGLTPLAHAFTYEFQDIAQMLMKHGATIYTDVTKKSTVLHLAAEAKSLKMLRFILKHNININSRDSNGKFALQILLENHPFHTFDHLVGKNKLEMIRLLIMKGALVDFRSNNGKSPLHYVVAFKEKDMIKSILEKIKDVNLCDDQKRTALHYLLNSDYKSENDVFDIVKLFIQKGAKLDIADRQRVTVAHIAGEKKYLNILNKFLQCQCNVVIKDSEGNTILHKLLESSSHLSGKEDVTSLVDSILSIAPLENIQNSLGETPMHLAANNYHYQILEKMLFKCKDFNIRSQSCGETLLHILAKHFSNENYSIIKHLLNAGANVDIKNTYDITPVDVALRIGNKNLLLLVLQRSKNLKQYNFQQKTALHCLTDIQVDSKNEELEVVKIAKICIDQGIHVDATDNLSRTPLCTAVFNQRKYMVKFLLEYGANPNFNTSIGIIQYLVAKPCLSTVDLEIADILVSKGASIYIAFKHLLALLKHIDLSKHIIRLLDHCENLNVLDLAGNTVLHAILDSNSHTKETIYSIFKVFSNFFLLKGVSINAKNKDGFTLLNLAAKNNHSSVYELLLKNCATNVLRQSAGLSLSDDCAEKIFKFLNKKDFMNLIQAAQLKTIKRKRVCTGGVECTPPKRVQR